MKQLVLIVSLVLYGLVSTAAIFAARQGGSAAAGGRTVWDGVLTDEQAARGATQFREHCAGCHGADLQGGEAKALAGERFWTDFQETTVDYLLRQISSSMPFSEDGSLAGTLPVSTYVDIVAHILTSNGFPAGKQELTPESSTGVRIVSRSGPGELPDGAIAHVVGCLSRGADGSWRLVSASSPARVMTGQSPDVRRALGSREYALMFLITRLDKYVGHRMSATGKLIGPGGAGGLNVTSVTSVAERCE